MTFDKIRTLLCNQLGLKEDVIKPESRILEDLGADSLDVVELLMLLEDEFGIEVDEEQAVNLKTVNDIVKLVDKK
jgi:acyl carrier protein